MLNTWSNAGLTIAGSFELSIVIKATIIAAVALAGAYLARDARAAARHGLLAATFGVLLALPLTAILLPPLAVHLPIGPGDALLPPVVDRADGIDLTRPSVAIEDVGSVNNRRRLPSAMTLLRAGWALGATLSLVPLVSACRRLRLVRRRGSPWLKGEALVQRLATDAGIRRRVALLLHDDVAAPMTCGVVRPAIVLPVDAADWSDADLRRAIVHELEHVYRGDWPVQLMARVVCAVYWFHPFVWAAWRRLCLEAERACDDAVLRGADRIAYAEQLVMLARRLSIRATRPALSMASRSDLSARVSAVLNDRQSRGRTGVVYSATTMTAAVVLLLGLSPLAVIARSGSNSTPIQGAASNDAVFDVASIKPNKSGDDRRRGVGLPPGGRFMGTNLPLRSIIRFAYEIQDFQLSGGPAWLNSDFYDIEAKAGPAQINAHGEVPPDTMRAMVRALLADRFKLSARRETRTLPVYALVVARGDKRVGARLQPAIVDCEALAQSGQQPPPPAPGARPVCGGQLRAGHFALNGFPLSHLVANLSTWVERVVLDRTGLAGAFNVDLEWAVEHRPPFDAIGAPAEPVDIPTERTGPSIFTALEEQLGLKLESTTGPVDVLVIDKVERPTAD